MFNDDPLSKTEDQSGLYSVSAPAQQSEEGNIVALGQVHLRKDTDVTEYSYERWTTVTRRGFRTGCLHHAISINNDHGGTECTDKRGLCGLRPRRIF